MTCPPVVVLDACAVIAFLNGEAGAEKVDELIAAESQLHIAAINALEVAYDAVRSTADPDISTTVLEAIERIPCRIEWSISREVFMGAAQFKANNRISLADAFALAFAQSLKAPLASTDHHEFDAIQQNSQFPFFWLR